MRLVVRLHYAHARLIDVRLKSPESGHRSGNMALTANGAATTALRVIGKLTGTM